MVSLYLLQKRSSSLHHSSITLHCWKWNPSASRDELSWFRITYQHELKMNHLDHRQRQALLHPCSAPCHLTSCDGGRALLLPIQSLLRFNVKGSHLGPLGASFNSFEMWFVHNASQHQCLVWVSDCCSLHCPLLIPVTLFFPPAK